MLSAVKHLLLRMIYWQNSRAIARKYFPCAGASTGVKGRFVNIFEQSKEKKRSILSIAWYILLVALYGFGLYQVFSHAPINFYRLFEYTFFFVVVLISSMLVSRGLFARPGVRNSPLWILVAIVSWGIFVYPVFTYSPINYSQILVYTLVFGICIYVQVKGTIADRRNAKNEDDGL